MLGLRTDFFRILITFFTVILIGMFVYFFYGFITTQLTNNLRTESQNRSSLFAGNIKGDIQRHTIVPRILDRDERIAASFLIPDLTLNDEFERIASELENSELYIVSHDLRIINSSNTARVGDLFEYDIIVEQAMQDGGADFYNKITNQYYSSRRVSDPYTRLPLGIIVVQIDFTRYQTSWRRLGVDMLLTFQNGEVLIAANEQYNSTNIQSILDLDPEIEPEQDQFSKVFKINQEDIFVFQTEVGIGSWKLYLFNSAQRTQQLIQGYVALLVLTLASFILFGLYMLSRRSARSNARFRRESEELRALNARLMTEMEQRRLAEDNLQTAEQSLEQSSKLAVIGQMSAAVGHELNQPLAAMRTYLAGVRTLLRRSRFLEAGQNLNRIDDLIDRMGSITRQMRSFARAHEGQQSHFDLREALLNSFELMTPQLGQMKVRIKRNIPEEPIMVQGDMVRTEQILINLLRNALEATSGDEGDEIEMTLRQGNDRAFVIISDNGHGIADIDKLFEPFYTTKAPGDGLGLGLATSASYAKDMGGILLARQNDPKGAVFELNLALATSK